MSTSLPKKYRPVIRPDLAKLLLRRAYKNKRDGTTELTMILEKELKKD